MPQTLEEFTRGTPFAREVDRLRALESAVIVFLVAMDQDAHKVADETLAQLRVYVAGKLATCPLCRAMCHRYTDGGRAWTVCTAGCGFSEPVAPAASETG